MKISVIGSGGWGTAIALLLSKNGHEVCLWSYKKEESENLQRDRENKEFLPGVSFGDYDMKFTSDIEEAASFGEFLVSAVPSKAVPTTTRAQNTCCKHHYSYHPFSFHHSLFFC